MEVYAYVPHIRKYRLCAICGGAVVLYLVKCPLTDDLLRGIKMNPTRRAVSKLDQIERAEYIRRSLGVRSAAGYLRDRGWSIDAALWLLARRP